jgi:hypothetical protein
LKILGVVFGVLLLLAGIGLLAGSAVSGATDRAIQDELPKQGLSGPVEGGVTAAGQGGTYTVSYTDKEGNAQTGTGPVVSGTEPPSVGDAVSVYYNTANPSQIAIFDLPGSADFGGIAGTLRTAGIVCLIVRRAAAAGRHHRAGQRQEGPRRHDGLPGRRSAAGPSRSTRTRPGAALPAAVRTAGPFGPAGTPAAAIPTNGLSLHFGCTSPCTLWGSALHPLERVQRQLRGAGWVF